MRIRTFFKKIAACTLSAAVLLSPASALGADIQTDMNSFPTRRSSDLIQNLLQVKQKISMVLRLTQIWKLFIRISHSELMTKTIVLRMSLMQVCGFSHSLKAMAMRFLHMILLILTLQEPTILSLSQVSLTRQS